MKKLLTQQIRNNMQTMKSSVALLFVLLVSVFGLQAQSPSFVLDIQGETLNFSETKRTVLVNTGSNGTNPGSKHKYTNLITKDGITVDAILTILEKSPNTNVTKFDDDTQEGVPSRFQPRIEATTSAGGYVLYELEFFEHITEATVYVFNYNLTAVDIDGNGSNNREYVEVGGYTSYSVNNPTQLVISAGQGGRTRFLGRTSSLNGIVFENTCAMIANYQNANNKITFALGQTGNNSNSARMYSVQFGIAGGVFTNPTTVNNPLPVAIDDVGTPVQSTAGGVAVNNVLSNDIYDGNPLNPSAVYLTLDTPATNPGIKLNTSTGKVTVDPGTPGGTYTLVYKICMKNKPSDCDIATVTVKVLSADVMITKTASSNTPQMGSNITFTLTAKNNGPDEATNVVVNDALPSGYTFVSATPSTGTWSAPNWNIGTLAKNATATLDIVATVKTTGTYQNTATISATEYDPTPGNNSSSVTPVPVPVADLSVTKTASNMAPIVGTNVTFTITAKNNGPVNATGVKVNDVLPSGYTFVNATPSVGTWSAPNWTIGNLADGASATLTIVATVKSSGNYENTAAISGNQTDPTPGNNSSTSTPVPVAAADLSVTKVANNNAPVVGSQVTFTITAKNNGPSNATGVKVNDVLPSGYTFVSATPSVGTWSAPNWTIGSLANGATATMTVKATVNASGDYTNTAAISGDQTDPTPGNNSSTSTPVPVGAADLSVTKVADNNNPAVGTQVTFTITAKNNGPSNATGVKVNDALPSGYTFVSATPSVGTWSAPNWTIGSLANGATATMTVKATVNASGDYTNTAAISGDQTDPTPGNNSSTSTPVPVGAADLSVTKVADNNNPAVGTQVTFTITAKNNGPSNATGVKVNDALPSGYTFVSATPSVGTWSAPNWTIGSLANGATATMTVKATVNASGDYTNTAAISGDQGDPNTTNNSSTSTPVPVGAADLSVTKVADNNNPAVGTQVTFTITAKNNGPSNATGVKVNDALPSGYTFVSATPSVGTWSAPNWTIGSLANGATATMTVKATVNASGDYTNTAAISGDQTDPTPGNNSSTSTPVPVGVADLSVTKVADNNNPAVGTQVTFTITAKNNGPSNATGVKVNDALPSGYTFVSATPSVGTWSAPNWTIGSLANGATATMTVKATVNASGDYTNTAAISGDQTDPTPGNNSSSVTPSPSAVADLSVTKVADNNAPVVGSQVTFTITAKNNGPSNATGVKVNDALPSGYTFVSATPSVGTWSAPNWTIGSLANGATATMTVKATVNASGDYTNTAAISGDQTDPTPGNNSSSVTPSPSAVADLSVTKTLDKTNPHVGETVVFTITAKNNGPSAASGVVVNDQVPAGFTVTNSSVSAGTWTAPNWNIGNLANGASATLTLTATVNSGGSYSNTASISGNQNDPNSANNSATATAVPGPKAVDDNTSTTLNTPVNILILTNDLQGAGALNPASVTFVGTLPNPATIGTFTKDNAGTVTFTPAFGFTGTATVDYQVCDANALCDVATITVVVNTVPGPDAKDDAAATDMNTPVDINVLANDLPGAKPLVPSTVQIVAGTEPNPTTQGSFTVNPTTGLVTFTPANGFTGTVTADYQVCDQNALCDVATITVVVNSVAGPDAIDDVASTVMNTPVEIDVLANDVPGVKPIVPSTVQIVPGTEPNPVTEGSFTVDPLTGMVTFTPVNGFIGTVHADYKVCDQNGLCDVAKITVNIIPGTDILYPALGFGTLAFEDLWPAKGDYDFNDLVLDYQFRILINTSNKVQKVTGTFIIRAFGAAFENGFGFQLPQTVNPADLTVSGYELSESFINLDGNGTESGQNAPTIIVYDNAYNQMPHPGVGIGVNTTPGAPYVTPDTLTITIDFKPNAVSFNELDISNFNPFLIVNKVRGHEVHLPGYKPTALVNTALFGQDDDDTKPTNGKYYVTNNNLPWAINIYEKFDYPIEKQDILAVHLKFAEWATSGGVLFPDWYKNLNGYRNNALIYQVPPTNP
ncbi:hypothetical protein MASR2M12_07850 [Bacteroidales bacterium]